MDPLEDLPEGPLSDLERRLERWRPLPGSLDRDRMLFDAGRAAARAESWGRLGAALAASFALVAVGLGGLLVRERGDRHALEATLAERTREPALPERVSPLPTFAEPAPNSYLALSRRILASGLEELPQAASNAPRGEIPERPEPPLTPLDARWRGGLMDL